ncbi:hypothetical protein T4E_7242 [Trichinella pseudospiralis]|uniref:Uncharacterized protein n=1 Tax=Trichinella pseudospiralis TaxID=6337 RepID=A0A0V0XHG2_TRIPS|nr:hypothetical protein T4E_7242 [Trichinella pseudospiralis]
MFCGENNIRSIKAYIYLRRKGFSGKEYSGENRWADTGSRTERKRPKVLRVNRSGSDKMLGDSLVMKRYQGYMTQITATRLNEGVKSCCTHQAPQNGMKVGGEKTAPVKNTTTHIFCKHAAQGQIKWALL